MTSIACTYDTLNAHQRPTVGDSKFSAVNHDHLGWLKCDGRLLNVTDYYFLWEVIGYSYGGSGTQFYLPDPAGRVPGVVGSGSGLTTRVLGASVGEETHTLTVGEMPTHSHTGTTDVGNADISDPGHTHSYTGTANNNVNRGLAIDNTPANSGTTSGTTGNSTTDITDSGHTHTFTTETEGGSNAHNNMQPTLFMGNMFIYCGKANEGTYPYFGGNIM